MANHLRDPKREAFWRGVLKRWRDSGLSVRAFCRREALGESNFYAWRRTIAQRDAESKQAAGMKGGTKRSAGRTGRATQRNGRSTKAPAFVPVVVAGESEREVGIIIELAGGRRLLLSEAIAPQRLAEVVHALEADASEAGDSRIDAIAAGTSR